MAYSTAATRWRSHQWAFWPLLFEKASGYGRSDFCGRGFRPLRVGKLAAYTSADENPSYGETRNLDCSRNRFPRRFFFLSRPALHGDDPGGHRRGVPDPRLLGRIHGARGRLLPLLLVFEPLHVLHAHSGALQQLSADVCGLGGRGPGVVPSDWVLLHERFGGERRKKSVHREPDRRLWFSYRDVPAVPKVPLAELQ